MATLIVALATTIVYAWTLADATRVEDVLFLSSASLYGEPWRVLTSPFIHQIFPHFAFNLLTLWWFGRLVERGHGPRLFALAFFGALWTGHMVTLLVSTLPLHGISGGVCGLYGFLLVVDWKGNITNTIRQRFAYWLYPAALVALFVADWLGLIPIANLNHVAAIGYGSLVALATTSQAHRVGWQIMVAAVTLVTSVAGAWRSERPWQNLPALARLDCSVERRPAGDVTRNGFVRVAVIDRSKRRKLIYYVEPAGDKILVSSNSRLVYRLLPYIGTIWRIEGQDGECLAQFEATVPGTIMGPFISSSPPHR